MLDASVTISWCFEDKTTTITEELLEKLTNERAFVPILWIYEVSNVLIVAQRSKRLNNLQAREFMDLLLRLPIVIDRDLVNMDKLFEIGRSNNLSSYDASYLELAQRLKLPLATLDKDLKMVAMRENIEVLV